MALWLILAAITLVTLGLLLFPLLRKRQSVFSAAGFDMAVYRDQLGEVDKDIGRGLLTQEQAAGVRTEIYRRMLAAEDIDAADTLDGPPESEGRDLFWHRSALALIVAVGLSLAGAALYAHLGSPSVHAQPYADRQNDPEFVMATEAERLAAELRDAPDAKAYKRLADTYFALRRYDDAAAAYGRITELDDGNAGAWSELGEAIVMSNDGLVTPEASRAFSTALRLDSVNPRARFYMGLLEAQTDRPRRAVAIWRDLERDSQPDSPWLPMLREHIATFAKEGGFDPEAIAPLPPALPSLHEVLPPSATAPPVNSAPP